MTEITFQEIKEKIKDKSLWEKDRINDDLWSYLPITEKVKIGRQKYDWAVFIRNKNYGFFYAENYSEIPDGLINAALNCINTVEKYRNLFKKKKL